jgi:hypothetical protein
MENTMRRTVVLSKRHDNILLELCRKMDTNFTDTIQRALEALEEKEARRDKELRDEK